ncbi:MAG TPA: hypothetical protein VLM89_16425, partial [Phycisphaerae bacterium]|nr:hypothetical protein [Phycisphaerae bacterium]
GRGFATHALAAPLLAEARQLAERVAERDPDVSDTDALRTGTRALLRTLADFHVDALRQKVGFASELINADQPEVVERLARGRPTSIVAGLRRLAEADANLGRNVHVELAIGTLFLHLAAETRSVPIPSSPLAAG